MRRRQTRFPTWWTEAKITARQREKLTAHFHIHRDGYQRWYKGRPLFVCGKNTPPEQVEDRWKARTAEVDAAEKGETLPPPPEVRVYRTVLSEFLTHQHGRIGAQRDPIEQRTYDNYVKELNDFGAFVYEGRKIADTDVRQIGPGHFAAYAGRFKKWKASGFDSVVTRVGALFRWAAEMEYIDRYRPGPAFQRPAKQELRDQRIERRRAFTPGEVARLYDAAGGTIRCWILLGVCAGFNNSDIAHLTRDVIDLDTGIIDFRRRKKGKIRRVIPLPANVVEELRGYRRPPPAEAADEGLFFLTRDGRPYDACPSTISRLFREVMVAAGLEVGEGRNFAGLRTTFSNERPPNHTDEVEAIMGHAQGTILLDNYSEDFDLTRLRFVVGHVWGKVKAAIDKLAGEKNGQTAAVTTVSTARPGAAPDDPTAGGEAAAVAAQSERLPVGSGATATLPAPG